MKLDVLTYEFFNIIPNYAEKKFTKKVECYFIIK